jgi:hypothetical protein
MSGMSERGSRLYRGRAVAGPFRTFDAGEAEVLEREIGRPTPPAYQRFLKTGGGGFFDYGTDVPPGSGGEILSFDELYRLGRDDDGDFEAYLDCVFIDPDIAETTWEDAVDIDPADSWRRTVGEWLDIGLPGWRDRPWAAN